MGLFSKKPEVPEGGILLHVDAGRSYFGSAVGTAGALKLMQHPSGAVFVYGKTDRLFSQLLIMSGTGRNTKLLRLQRKMYRTKAQKRAGQSELAV